MAAWTPIECWFSHADEQRYRLKFWWMVFRHFSPAIRALAYGAALILIAFTVITSVRGQPPSGAGARIPQVITDQISKHEQQLEDNRRYHDQLDRLDIGPRLTAVELGIKTNREMFESKLDVLRDLLLVAMVPICLLAFERMVALIRSQSGARGK